MIKIQVSVFLILSSLIGFSQASPCSKSIDSLLTIGSALSFSEPDSSFYYFDKSEIYSRQCKYDLGLTRSKNFKGLYFALKGEYEKASELYFEGIEIAQKNQLDSEEAIIKNNLGALYFDLNEFEKAKSYYEESLSKMIELQDSVWIGKIYTNLAGVYFMKEEYDLSIQMLNLSIEYARLTERYEAMGGAMANLAMVNMALGNQDQAIKGFNDGIELLDSIGDKRGVAISMVEKSKFLYQNKRFEEALSTLDEAETYAREVNHTESIIKIFKLRGELHEALGQYENALNDTRSLIKFQDSLHIEERRKVTLELEEKYQNQQKEQQIRFLEDKDELNSELVIRQKQVSLYLIILIVALTLFFGFVLWQWNKKRRLNQALEEKNLEIQQNLEERELLIREVHHRVKNNLQIVSGMLNVQAHSVEEQQIKEALLESRKRVQSMAIVHTQLYQTENIDTIDFKKYILHLIEQIENQFDFEHSEQISLECNITEVFISVDDAISMGLIINEVVTNAFKHAFKPETQGTIFVELREQDEHLTLKISDNGVGFNPEEIREQSFGIRLIRSLTKSLKASCKWEIENGTIFYLSLKHE